MGEKNKDKMDVDEVENVSTMFANKEALEWLSPIHSNFHFQIEFKYECTKCKYARTKIESFREMSLDLPLIKIIKKQNEKIGETQKQCVPINDTQKQNEQIGEVQKDKEENEETKDNNEDRKKKKKKS